MGRVHRWRNSYRWWRNCSRLGRHCPLTRWKTTHHVWSSQLPLSSPCFVQERDYTSTTRRNPTASLKRCLSSGLQDRPPTAHKQTFFWLKTRCQRMYGNDSVTHERTFGYDELAAVVAISVEHWNHHATHLQPRAKRRTWTLLLLQFQSRY